MLLVRRKLLFKVYNATGKLTKGVIVFIEKEMKDTPALKLTRHFISMKAICLSVLKLIYLSDF